MKEIIRIMGTGILSIVIATIFLKIAVNYDDSFVDKIGEVGKTRLEGSVETTSYPKVKVVDPADNIEVYFGNTLLFTGQLYSLHGIIYASTDKGEMLNITFEGVCGEKGNVPVSYDPESGYITFMTPGVYKVLMTVRDEVYEMDIPVSGRWN